MLKKEHLQVAVVTHRFNKTVSTPFVDIVPVDWGNPHAGVGSGLTRVPARTASSRKTGGAIAPHWLAGAGGLIHQDHRGVNELSPVSRGVEHSWKRSGASCCCVCPGGG